MKKHVSEFASAFLAVVFSILAVCNPALGIPQAMTASALGAPDGTIVIQTLAEANNRVVDIEGGNLTERTNCQLYDRNNSAAQICRFISAGSGYYYILLAKTKNMVLDVKGGKGFSGCNVQLFAANGSDGQLWTFVRQP